MPSKPSINKHLKMAQEDRTGPADPSPDRALVVDDDPEICDVIAAALERVGYEVISVSSADAALEVFDQKHPDVLISDWKMPGQDGIELVTSLKQRDPNLAAILMTGYGTKETVVEAFTRGKINYYLSKPFKLDELLEVVSAALKERRLQLSERRFRRRLENEIQRATRELEEKNRLLQQKHTESECLYRELRLRQEEVEGTKNYLENLIESSVDGIISVTRSLVISFFSRGAEEMFGYKNEDVLGRHLELLFPPGRDDLNRLLRQLKSQKRLQHFETEMLRAKGEKLIADISVSLLTGQLGEQGILLIIKDIAERKRLEEELRSSNIVLEQLSITDGLTGLYNHRHFQACLAEEFQRARRFQTPLSLIMLDLDDFKQVNDTYGHQVGDRVLVLLAELIRECVREVDTPARYGGEEFAIVLPQTDVDDAVVVAKRLKDAVEKSGRFQEFQPGLTITASLGLTGCPDPYLRTPQDLIRFADKALYRAKHIGKNRVVIGSSSGETPLGRGERLTQAEKKIILRRIGDTLRSTLDLDRVLKFLLAEISQTLRQTEAAPPCSIMLLDHNRGLRTAAELDMDEKHRQVFDVAAHLALEKKSFQVFYEDDQYGPSVSYPIIVKWPDRGEEVVGVINIGTVPADLDFFRDITNHAAIGILSAKLYSEAQVSKANLENKVTQLMTLSLMGMALQRNALNYPDFHEENKKLLARCLAQVGFERVFVFDWDEGSERLTRGVDNSLRGDNAPAELSLAGLEEDHRLRRALARPVPQQAPVVLCTTAEEISPAERSSLWPLDLGRSGLVAAKLVEAGKPWGVVIALKEGLGEEDAEAVSTFVLHASLITENLNLSRRYQDKSQRLALIHGIARQLALAGTPASKAKAAAWALEGLTRALQAGEISLYLGSPEGRSLELLAYASDTAGPAGGPAKRPMLKDCPVMIEVFREAMNSGRSEPLVINDLNDRLGPRRRRRFTTNSYLGVPLIGGGNVLGLMNVTDKLDRTPFTPEDAELAQITAGMLGSFLFQHKIWQELEDRTLETIKALVGERAAGPRTGRTAELTRSMAEVMGLSREDSERVARAAWVRGLESAGPGPGGVQPAAPAKIMGEWLESLARTGLAPGLEGPGKADHGLWAERIIPVADFLSARYLDLPPRRRPALDQVLFELVERTPSTYDIGAVEALVSGLARGRIRSGRRKIKPEDAWGTRLASRLAGLAKVKGRSAAGRKAARRILETIDGLPAGKHDRRGPK
ncbi:MAG: diguanylate cyclase [Thermodesulfobacteriota bacterium]